jgi:hypothetical protein
MTKVAYKPLATAASVVGGILAGRIFHAIWKKVTDEEEAPRATERDRSWSEIVTAAALQGAIFGAVKAAFDRAGAKSFERATGTWPV